MVNEQEKQQHLKDIRRAYILAKVVNIQYVWIREFIHPSLLKPLNNAKAANSFFIKQIDDAFLNINKGKDIISKEEEMAFKLLEELEKLEKQEKLDNLKNVNY
jgi:hypothetical protein